jgi:outer membrane lipoprotein-sorting protein
MTRMTAVVAFFFSLVLSIPSHAAAAKQYVLTINPQALTVAQATFSAMGGIQAVAGYQDSQSTGTVTIYSGGSPTSYSITLKSKGQRETRVELQKANGTNIRIVNQGQGAIIHPDGSVKNLWSNNTFYEYVNHVPLLSVLGEYANGTVNLLYNGVAQVQGQSEDVVEVDFVPSLDPVNGPIFASMSRTLFYVNQTNRLVDKIQTTPLYEGGNKDTFTEETYLSDYRSVNGMLVPFHQTVYVDGQLDTDLTFTSVSFNVGLPDSEFALPQAR